VCVRARGGWSGIASPRMCPSHSGTSPPAHRRLAPLRAAARARSNLVPLCNAARVSVLCARVCGGASCEAERPLSLPSPLVLRAAPRAAL
jgi:hypothetical protein